LYARAQSHRPVHKDVATAIVWRNEAKAFIGLEPLHDSRQFRFRSRLGRPCVCMRYFTNAQNLNDAQNLTPFRAVADLNQQLGSLSDVPQTCATYNRRVNKSVGRSISWGDKTKTFCQTKPFNHGLGLKSLVRARGHIKG